MSGLRLSVVIPTYNRRERLQRVLEALEAQTVAPESFEAVVVDDGSTDGTSEWLASQRYRYRLRPLRQANSGPAVARNTGVANAEGELLLFIDDDVVPVPELVSEHLRSHDAEDIELAVIGPLASLPHYDAPWVAWEQEKVERQYSAMARGDYPPTFRQFWTGNASVSREQVLAAGSFNASYLRAEDVELGVRLHERGVAFRFNARARGLHHADRSLESWSKAHSSYGRLEVDILGRLGQDALLEMLAGNFGRLRPSMQWLLRRCIGHPLRYASVTAALRSLLRSKAAGLESISGPACSALANLLYWQASSEALGAERFSVVLRQAGEASTR